MVDDPTNPTVSLDFGVPREIYWETGHYTDNNLYNKYYKQFLEETLNIGSRIVSGKFNLTRADIASLDFRNTIYIDGINYRLNKITDYDPNIDKLTDVELIKIKNKQTFEQTSGTILGGGGTLFVPSGPDLSVSTSEVKPVKDRTAVVGQDGNAYLPEQGQRVSGQNNIIHPSASFVEVSGISNFVGSDTRYISLVNSSGCIVDATAKNVSIVNSSGVIVSAGLVNVAAINSPPRTITESNIVYIGNQVFRNSSTTLDILSIKVSLTAAQIKTINSVHVDTGIESPGPGFAIEILSAMERFNYGTTPFTSTYLALTTPISSGGGFQFYLLGLDSNFSFIEKMDQNNLAAAEVYEDQKIIVSGDADSAVGDSTVDLYIYYRIVTL